MNASRFRPTRRLFSLLAACALLVTLAVVPVRADNAAAAYKKGQDLEARQDYEGAYTAYQEAWREKPKDLRYRTAAMRLRFLAGAAHVHRGQQLREAGKLQEALAEFEKAATIDPGSFVASQETQRTRMLIDAARSAASTAAPAPPTFIERRLEKASSEPTELAPISSQPITLKMTEDSKLIFEMVGSLAGINVLFDPDYPARKVHVDLNGVTLAQALRMIALEAKAFWRPVTANTIFVAADTPGKRKDLEENIIKTFYLTNLSQTSQLQTVVTALHTLLELSRVTPVPELGAIIVRGTPDQLALTSKIISDLDKGRAEVVVDVAVMQVTRDKIHDIGMTVPTSATVYPTSNVVTSTSGTSGTSTTSTGTTSGTVTFGHFRGSTFAVNIPSVTANMLLSDGNTKVIQNPQIRVADGQKATLKIGDRVPVATGSYQAGVGTTAVSALVNTQFQYLDVGVNIDITPHIHGDRSVTLKVSMEISSVTGSVNIGGISEPTIGQRRIEHEIRLKEGEVNMLGGIMEQSDIKSVGGYPGLSSIPLLKYLFSDQHTERHDNEIVFLITPHVVRAPEVLPENLRPLQVGTGSTIDLQDNDAAALARATPAPRPADAGGAQAVALRQPALAPAPASAMPAAAPMQVQYDPTKLQVVSVSNGSFLAQGEQAVALAQRDDATTGTVRITAMRPPDSGGASGSGSVATITFLAKGTGKTSVSIARAGLRNADQQPVASSGTPALVEVKPAPTTQAMAAR